MDVKETNSRMSLMTSYGHAFQVSFPVPINSLVPFFLIYFYYNVMVYSFQRHEVM